MMCTGCILRCFHSWFKVSVLSKIFWRLELNIVFTSSALLNLLSCLSLMYSDFTRFRQQTGPFSDFFPVWPMIIKSQTVLSTMKVQGESNSGHQTWWHASLPAKTSWQPLNLLLRNYCSMPREARERDDFRDESYYLPFTFCCLQMYISPNELKIGDPFHSKIILASILFPTVPFYGGRETFAQLVWWCD